MISFDGQPAIGFAGASCPANPPAPAGFAVWKGPVPPELTQWAIMLRDHIAAYPYGQLFAARWGAIDVVARKDHHTWTFRRRPDGSTTLAQNICIPGITLYRPASAAGVSGLGADDVLDPAAAAPDPELALYSGAPPRTSWVPAALAGTALGAAAASLFWRRRNLA
jgi:hypothetical protein